MTKEAVIHVQEAESTVAKIRENANGNIRAIESKKEKQIQKINQDVQDELQTFKIEQRQKFEEQLVNTRNRNKKLVMDAAEKYQTSYEKNQEELSDYIVREVLRRYGG